MVAIEIFDKAKLHEGMQMDEIRKRNTNDTVAQMKWGFKPEEKASAPN